MAKRNHHNLLISGAVGLFLLNKYIDENAKGRRAISDDHGYYYAWENNEIYYTKTGNGSPILLIHDESAIASNYEWHFLQKKLSSHHTVYAIDLIGCGQSDRPRITYTNYLLVKLIRDFISLVIKKPADLVTSNRSSEIGLMAKLTAPEWINKIILINPKKIQTKNFITTLDQFLLRLVYYIPILGNTVYNHQISESKIKSVLEETYLYHHTVTKKMLDICYETAHWKGSSGRFFYASQKCHYMDVNVTKALQTYYKDICILCGRKNPDKDEIADQYHAIYAEIPFIEIQRTKLLPHIEETNETAEEIERFLLKENDSK